jgi:hypothetical protein
MSKSVFCHRTFIPVCPSISVYLAKLNTEFIACKLVLHLNKLILHFYKLAAILFSGSRLYLTSMRCQCTIRNVK